MRRILTIVLLAGWVDTAKAWDYDGHRLVNTLAASTLPADFPIAVNQPAIRERLAFLGGEPDRWRNSSIQTFRHSSNPEHYFDCDYLPDFGLEAHEVSPFRYMFTRQMIEAEAAHPGVVKFDAAQDREQNRWLIGFLPWAISEHYGKLKASFSYLRTFRELGTPEEIANAEANAIYVMGVMGHFVADAAQPLHTTRNYNGWTDANPAGYTSNKTIHAWIDGGYLKLHPLSEEVLRAKIKPAALPWKSSEAGPGATLFPESLAFVFRQFEKVEPLYLMEKEGKFAREGTLEGTAFLEGQILEAAQFLGQIWFTAWKEAKPDVFLTGRLRERKIEEGK